MRFNELYNHNFEKVLLLFAYANIRYFGSCFETGAEKNECCRRLFYPQPHLNCKHLYFSTSQHLFVSRSFRVCYTFGNRIKFQIQDITSTFLSPGVISTLRQADHVAHSVIRKHGKETQMVKMSFSIKSRQEHVRAQFIRVDREEKR